MVLFVSCKQPIESDSDASIQPPGESQFQSDSPSQTKTQSVESGGNEMNEISKIFEEQLSMPQAGETIAIMKTNLGTISIKFFKEDAPKAVENFLTHAQQGYYDGITFHRVIDGFMIQGGDPSGNGTGGESIWGKPFEDEFSSDRRHFRGALSMANAGPNTNGSQFFIVQAASANEDYLQQMLSNPSYVEIGNAYQKNGGTPFLDGRHTVFGQVYEGIDIVDAIAKVDKNAADMPRTPVIIESIEVKPYKAS